MRIFLIIIMSLVAILGIWLVGATLTSNSGIHDEEIYMMTVLGLPAIYFYYLVARLIIQKDFYHKYVWTIRLLKWPILIVLLLLVIWIITWIINGSEFFGWGLFFMLLLLGLGCLVGSVLSLIGHIIDSRKIRNNAHKFLKNS